ncbi:MAG: TMEM14 family protein [Candidatus Obscuribacterales bacterium]|jgi:uncharacterized membrane protein (UPF0136 family)
MTAVAHYAIIILSTFVLVGGIIGFKKAGSKASLIAGGISSVLLDACFALGFANMQAGFIAALVVTGLLDAFFAKRLMKSKKFMPSGMILLLCLITQALIAAALVTK